jgi:hypothetical protein
MSCCRSSRSGNAAGATNEPLGSTGGVTLECNVAIQTDASWGAPCEEKTRGPASASLPASASDPRRGCVRRPSAWGSGRLSSLPGDRLRNAGHWAEFNDPRGPWRTPLKETEAPVIAFVFTVCLVTVPWADWTRCGGLISDTRQSRTPCSRVARPGARPLSDQ